MTSFYFGMIRRLEWTTGILLWQNTVVVRSVERSPENEARSILFSGQAEKALAAIVSGVPK